MRLMADKTWSQQQLAKKLQVDRPERAGWLSCEHRRLLIHAAKTALAAGLCWWLAPRFGLHDGYWGAISAIIVLQSNFGSTITASRDRLLGTLIGAVFGFSFSLFGTLPWNYILAVFAAMTVCGLLGFRSSSRLAGVTITIVMLVQNGTSHWTVALDRVGQVVLGIVVALAGLDACFSRPCPAATARWTGAGIPCAGRIFRGDPARLSAARRRESGDAHARMPGLSAQQQPTARSSAQ